MSMTDPAVRVDEAHRTDRADEAEDTRARVQALLDALVRELVLDEAGRARDPLVTHGLVDGVRAALDRLASGDGEADATAAGGSLSPGDFLANSFVVRELLGTGGMAEVYRVRHRDLRHDYAAKILKPERALDGLVADCFAAEARALLDIRHDAIVRAHAFLRHGDGRNFLLLDLVRGPTLARRIAEAPLTPEELQALAARLASALACLHAVGFIHGDLSAENVVVAGAVEGAVLLDLGLLHAGALGAGEIAFSGRWSIAAPEHLAGAPLSAATDLYALGLLLLSAASAAAGAAPLALGTDPASALAARAAGFDLEPVPKVLRPLIAALLDPDPAARPAAAACADRIEHPGLLQRLVGAAI